MKDFALVMPSRERLGSYMDALARGFSPDNLRDVSAEELAKVQADVDGYLESLNGDQAGMFITLPNGDKVPRIPMMTRWMWDGEFAGVIKFRYVPGGNTLPPYILGHMGYFVPEWKRGKGYATQALAMMLPLAERVGVSEIALTCLPENEVSQAVILANGGRLVKEITVPEYGPAKRLLFVVPTGDDL